MTTRSILLILLAIALFVGRRVLIKKEILKKKSVKILTGILTFLLIFGLLHFAILFPGFKKIATTGSFEFKTKIVELTDNSRDEAFNNNASKRTLAVEVFYPVLATGSENSAPLVIFSHGGLGNKDSNVSLYEELASHGYFVVSIDHTYHAFMTKINGKTIFIDRDYLSEITSERPDTDPNNSFALYEKWMKLRTDDISFVIDHFTDKNNSNPEEMALVDSDKIAVLGHSLGGAAALGMPRLRDDIDAAIALEAPFMVDILDVKDGKFDWNTEPYPSAMLNIYSDNVTAIMDTDQRYAQNKNYLINNDQIEFYHIKGSNHYTLIDLSLVSPILVRLVGGPHEMPARETLEKINELSLAFLDKHLK